MLFSGTRKKPAQDSITHAQETKRKFLVQVSALLGVSS